MLLIIRLKIKSRTFEKLTHASETADASSDLFMSRLCLFGPWFFIEIQYKTCAIKLMENHE